MHLKNVASHLQMNWTVQLVNIAQNLVPCISVHAKNVMGHIASGSYKHVFGLVRLLSKELGFTTTNLFVREACKAEREYLTPWYALCEESWNDVLYKPAHGSGSNSIVNGIGLFIALNESLQYDLGFSATHSLMTTEPDQSCIHLSLFTKCWTIKERYMTS
jgi:hypothetical protein